jgi:hypothetical protein
MAVNLPEINTRAVVAGGALALVVTVAAILIYRIIEVVADLRDDNNWVFLFVAIIVIGWGAGGFRAARAGGIDSPYTHGALAAFGAYLVVAVVAIARLVARGNGLPYHALAFFAIVAATAGIVGAMVSTARSPTSGPFRKLQ